MKNVELLHTILHSSFFLYWYSFKPSVFLADTNSFELSETLLRLY